MAEEISTEVVKAKARTARKPKAEEPVVAVAPRMLFGKYSYNVEVADLSLKNYIKLNDSEYPMTFRRHSQKDFSKANINIVERLINAMMRGGTGGKIGGRVIRTKGRLQGKKLKCTNIVATSFDSISNEKYAAPLLW